MSIRLALFAVTLAFLVTHAASARAQTALELTERARKEIQAFDDAKKAEIKKAMDDRKANPAAFDGAALGDSHQEQFALQRALSTLQSVQRSLESGNNENALQELGNVAPFGNLPKEVTPLLDALRQRVQADQREKSTAYYKDTDATVQRATAAVLQAKDAKELDDILKDLKRASELPVPNSSSSDERNVAARLRYSLAFVTHWQDYLIARGRNDDNEVRNILRNLTSETNVPLIARSEILARIPPTESERETTLRSRRAENIRPQSQIDADARGVIQGIHKLTDVSAALDKLVDLRTEETQGIRNYRSDSALNAALEGLESLQRSILEYRNGLTPNMGRLLSRTEIASHPEVNLTLWSLRMQLVREAAPHLMGVPADEKPGDDEPAGVYVRRLVDSAKSRQDWAAVIEGLQILRMLSPPDNGSYAFGNESDITAYQNLLTASNLEKAGQYEEAVTSYIGALHTSQRDLPAVWIGQHLTELQKAHPKEYTRARGRSAEEAQADYLEAIRAYQGRRAAPSDDPQTPAATPAPPPGATPALPAPTATIVASPTP